MKKQFWRKISGLSDDILEKDGEEVAVIYEESKRPKPKPKKDLIRRGREEAEEWLPGAGQGQLVVDIYEREDDLVVESTIAGVGVNDIDITVEPDLIVIRGERRRKEDSGPRRYYYQECFWGKFARTLVLPSPVKPEKVRANLKNGILTVILPKAEEKNQSIAIGE